MIGVYANFFAVLIGGILGTFLHNGISDRIKSALTQGVSLCVLVIGITGAIATDDIMMMIISIVIGTLLGEWIQIEKGLDRLGDYAQRKLVRNAGNHQFAEGFVSATLLFSVGAMALVGSLEAGLSNDGHTLLAKSILDFISSIVFASTFGAGVILSAVPLTIYQGGIALLAQWVAPLIQDPALINEMSAVGSLVIIALSLNMLELTKNRIRVGNMLPSMFVPILYMPIARWISQWV